jgi:transposase-like protein
LRRFFSFLRIEELHMGEPVIVSAKPPGKNWSDKVKAKAVRDYLKYGSYSEVARRNRIPGDTVREWKSKDWWKELTERYREELDVKLSSKIDDVVQKAVDEIHDRLENGEHILDSKTGEVLRIPTKARDMAAITKVLSDRQDILIKRKKVEQRDEGTLRDKLNSLAAQFSSFVKQTNVKPPEIVDGEFTHALVEEREEGLQT